VLQPECCRAGWSPFPGNINQLVLKLASYVPQLAATGGNISEFVNPKYKDASKTAFKSSTRLECMMQDYPKALPADAKVGFTVVNQVRLRARVDLVEELVALGVSWTKLPGSGQPGESTC
jgi:hypothetical protein